MALIRVVLRIKPLYPNVTSADKAKIVELAEGDQATNIDIVVSRTLPGFAVTGIVINGVG